MPTISIGTLRYDIVSDTTSFVRGIKATAKQKREADRIFREGLSPMQKHNHALIRMYALYKKGMITKEAVLAQQKKIKKTLFDEQAALRMSGVDLKKYSSSWNVLPTKIELTNKAIDRNTRSLLKNRAARAASGGGQNKDLANIGGSLGSALGGGGAGAGAGRILGLGSFGAVGALVAGGIMAKTIKEAAILETALVDLQVILGDNAAGTAMVNNLRDIARTTPLTSKALIKGAQTLLGYGLAAEGLEDTMYRIGEIAGGDAVRMDSLTRAFAQVQSAGKLMGQEMLQLVNAGFPVAEIAKAAGVSMEDFRKEMEEGNIKASHLTEAMVNLTSAGGLMEGRLARQADTIKGTWVTAVGSIEQSFAEIGMKSKDQWKGIIKFFGEFSVTALESFYAFKEAAFETVDGVGTLINDVAKFLFLDDELSDMKSWFFSSDALDEHGEKLSGYKRVIRGLSDTFLRLMGHSQKDIDAMRASDRAFHKMNDSALEAVEARKKFADGQEKIRQSVEKEVDTYTKAQKAKAKAIYDEMKPEEDLQAMLKRHWSERNKARIEMAKINAKTGSRAAGFKYMQATVARQKAEEAKMRKELADEQRKMQYDAAKDAENKRFDLEKRNIKRAIEFRKKKIGDQYDDSKRNAKAIGERGKFASMDSYTASAQIQAEYDQNRIVNKADDRREQQLEQLKKLEARADRNAQTRHDQRMKVLDNSYNNAGKP